MVESHGSSSTGGFYIVTPDRRLELAYLAEAGVVSGSAGASCHNQPVEVSLVRNRLKRAIDAARERGQQQRQRSAAAERAYDTFLKDVATPVTRLMANTLKVEGYPFTVFTPGGGLRLASDRHRDDYIEFAFDDDADPPQATARISHTRGSRTRSEERPIKAGAAPDELSEEDVLAFLLSALEPWLER
jgi:hypothetical protein